MADWYISNTIRTKLSFPLPPLELSEEAHIIWCRQVGRYLADAGYGESAIALLCRGQLPLAKKALKEGYRE